MSTQGSGSIDCVGDVSRGEWARPANGLVDMTECRGAVLCENRLRLRVATRIDASRQRVKRLETSNGLLAKGTVHQVG